jgi:uncharacterized pyridoxamine 5'-phosphate oxidase family protein
MKRSKLAVLASINHLGRPESALIGVAFSEDLEIVFDTVKSSRKYKNILKNPLVAFVIGWEDESTLQFEGIAHELHGEEGKKYKEIYFEAYPDGRQRNSNWPDIVHFVVRPKWIRYSNFLEPQVIEEMTF